MTNELEKQFFDTFGIEPKWKSEQCDGWLRTTAEAYFTNLEEAKKFGIVFQEEPEYPQITDTHYLKLICLMNVSLIKIVKLRGDNLEQLKNFILQACLTDYEFYSNSSLPEHIEQAENFKHQVRTLFEEG